MREAFLQSRQVILLYHRIARIESDPWSLCVTPEHFSEHLEVLRDCRLTELRYVKPSTDGQGVPSVIITFDDGYADNYYQALPLLRRYGIPATFFIAAGYIGESREFWWDELEKIVFQSATLSGILAFLEHFHLESQRSRSALYFKLYKYLQPMAHQTRRRLLNRLLQWTGQSATARDSHRVMTCNEICALARNNLVQIGAHTVTHPKLASQPPAIQKAEVRQSKTILEDIVNRPVTSFSYPYGGREHYSQKTVHLVREAGFCRACSTVARRVGRHDSLYELPRFNITDMSGEDLRRLLFS